MMRIGAALAVSAFSVAAFAQGTAPAGGHLYVGGGVGQGQWRPGCPGSVPNCDDTNTSLRVFSGYQINGTFAAEVGFDNFGKAGGSNFEVKGKAWEASALAGWPLVGPLSVYGRLGIFRGVVKGGGLQANTTESNYGPTYGVGTRFDLTPNLGLRAEWQAYPGVGGSTITRSDVKVISVSALWRFR